jgi:dTDP-4-amino-4,6-dideoxygalactose transaminase
MFVTRLDSHEKREGLAKHLKEQGIQTGVHYPVPNHQQPAITKRYNDIPRLPKTEDYCKRILSLPMFPSLTEQEVVMISNAIKQYLK